MRETAGNSLTLKTLQLGFRLICPRPQLASPIRRRRLHGLFSLRECLSGLFPSSRRGVRRCRRRTVLPGHKVDGSYNAPGWEAPLHLAEIQEGRAQVTPSLLTAHIGVRLYAPPRSDRALPQSCLGPVRPVRVGVALQLPAVESRSPGRKLDGRLIELPSVLVDESKLIVRVGVVRVQHGGIELPSKAPPGVHRIA